MKKIFTDEEKNNIQSNIIKTKDTISNNKNASPTIIFTIIPNDKIVGGTPMNNTENIAPSTNMKNPLVR